MSFEQDAVGVGRTVELVVTSADVDAYRALTGLAPVVEGLVQPEFLLAAMPPALGDDSVEPTNVSYGYDLVELNWCASVGERLSLSSRIVRTSVTDRKVHVEETCVNERGSFVVRAIHVFLYV